jgi:hypothetical protein
MNYVNFSTDESKKHNLRIGRTSIINNLDTSQLIDEIFGLNLDVCKLKIKLSDATVFSKLDSLKIPYGFYSLLIRQSIKLNKRFNFKKTQLDIRQYTPKNKKELIAIVQEVLENDTNLYYQNSIFEALFHEEISKAGIAEYQTTFDNAKDLNKHGFMAYLKKRPVGFCTLQINNDEGEGIFVGILPELRGNNFFREFVQTQILQSQLRGCKTYNCNTVVFNHRSLNTTLKQGMNIVDGILNINIFSLLNQNTCMAKTFTSNIRELLYNIQKEIRHFDTIVSPSAAPVNFQMNFREKHFRKVSWTLVPCFIHKEHLIFFVFDTKKINYGYLQYVL